ncbi:4-(cytidine 5'-diphospho)-2-C-methyl-D-erythritol kinase [Desulfovibrionales bacterium]
MSVELQAGCKVNLYLDIIGVRPDGYHLLESLFYPLPAPSDTLLLTECDGSGFILTCSRPELATSENLVAKAYARYQEWTGWAPGLTVHLEKRIPSGAGIGGGSSDAAVLLRWLNGRAGRNALSVSDLNVLGASLGADIPFFLQDGPAWVCGTGEILEPATVHLPGTFLVLVCPPVHISTAWAYERWDTVFPKTRSRKELTCPKCMVMTRSSTRLLGFYNAFEEVVFPEFPVLSHIKDKLCACGALAAVMSGSGASMVGLFQSDLQAEVALTELRRLGNECFKVSLAGTVCSLIS